MKHVALIDDHVLLRQGLANFIESLGNYKVLLQADNGSDYIEGVKSLSPPDIVLLDITMPIMDGYKTAQWIKANQPHIKILALSMIDEETAIIRMLRAGACGYLLKYTSLEELKLALDTVAAKGFYFNDIVSNTLIRNVRSAGIDAKTDTKVEFTERELEFLQHYCTELSTKEVAQRMGVSVRTLEGYRANVCDKTKTSSRIALTLFAIKHKLIKI